MSRYQARFVIFRYVCNIYAKHSYEALGFSSFCYLQEGFQRWSVGSDVLPNIRYMLLPLKSIHQNLFGLNVDLKFRNSLQQQVSSVKDLAIFLYESTVDVCELNRRLRFHPAERLE